MKTIKKIRLSPAMPLYEYHCTSCSADFELLIRGDEKAGDSAQGGAWTRTRTRPGAHVRLDQGVCRHQWRLSQLAAFRKGFYPRAREPVHSSHGSPTGFARASGPGRGRGSVEKTGKRSAGRAAQARGLWYDAAHGLGAEKMSASSNAVKLLWQRQLIPT